MAKDRAALLAILFALGVSMEALENITDPEQAIRSIVMDRLKGQEIPVGKKSLFKPLKYSQLKDLVDGKIIFVPNGKTSNQYRLMTGKLCIKHDGLWCYYSTGPLIPVDREIVAECEALI